MKNQKYVEVEMMFDLETLNFLNKVASLAGTDRNTVVNVILAAELIKMERDTNDAGKKSQDKRGNDKPSKKPRVARRAKSRRPRS